MTTTNKENKIISIDHGNRMIKTENYSFNASYIESSYLPSLTNEVIDFEGKSYTLAEQNNVVLSDKTVDDRYFILSLFAIAKELIGDGGTEQHFGGAIDIDLLIGLPLQHYKTLKKTFERYFWDRPMPVHFVYNNNKISINIKSVSSYPQGYAAAISIKDEIEDSSLVNIIDIGGYTVDCLEMEDFIPNMELLSSLNRGVNSLFELINDKLRSNIEKELTYKKIEDILKREKYTLSYDKKLVDLVTDTTKEFV